MRELEDGEWEQVSGGFDLDQPGLGNRRTCHIPELEPVKTQTLSREWLRPYINDPRESIETHYINFPNTLSIGLSQSSLQASPRQSVFENGTNPHAQRPDPGRSIGLSEKRTHQPVTMSWKMPYLNR